MLVYHSDASGDGIARNGKVRGGPVYENFAGVGYNEARQNVHQRRFACAVFAQYAEHLTRCERERYVVVGDYAGKAFGYSPQFKERRA